MRAKAFVFVTCAAFSACRGDPECSDAADNDKDGWSDDLDPDCTSDEAEEGSDTSDYACNDGLDNDGDGVKDADDPGCESGDDGLETDGLTVMPGYFEFPTGNENITDPAGFGTDLFAGVELSTWYYVTVDAIEEISEDITFTGSWEDGGSKKSATFGATGSSACNGTFSVSSLKYQATGCTQYTHMDPPARKTAADEPGDSLVTIQAATIEGVFVPDSSGSGASSVTAGLITGSLDLSSLAAETGSDADTLCGEYATWGEGDGAACSSCPDGSSEYCIPITIDLGDGAYDPDSL